MEISHLPNGPENTFTKGRCSGGGEDGRGRMDERTMKLFRQQLLIV